MPGSSDIIRISGGVALKLGTGYLYIDTDTKLRISGGLPSSTGDTTGIVVGSQTA
jgi:hypothetical protein